MSKLNPFKYYVKGTQIAVSVFVSVFLGYQIDVFFQNKIYFVTIVFSLLSIIYNLRSLIKEVNKEK